MSKPVFWENKKQHHQFESSVILAQRVVNVNVSNTDTSFTVVDSNSFFESLGQFFRQLKKTNILGYLRDLFFFCHENICFVYLLPSDDLNIN